MAGDYIYSAEGEQARFGGYGSADDFPLKPAASRKIEKGLKRLLLIAGIIIAAECIWLFGISPCIPFSTLEVKGFPGFDGADVLRYAGIGEGASFVSLNARQVEKTLADFYLVESAAVIKRFPDRLSIFLEPRRAVALSLAEFSGRVLPLYFDRHGVVFRIGNGWGEPENLPVISGLVIEHPVLGMRLPAAITPFLSDLAKIETDAPELLSAISELRINRKPYDGFDLVLYPVHNPVRVRLGSSINEDTLRYTLLMLDVIKSRGVKPEEIDFRSGMGAYKAKEAPSGE